MFAERARLVTFIVLLLAGELLLDLVEASLGFIERGQRLIGQLLGGCRELFALCGLAEGFFGERLDLVMAGIEVLLYGLLLRVERSFHFAGKLLGALGVSHGVTPCK